MNPPKEIKGLIIPKITPDHYILGGANSFKGAIIREKGQWDDVLPAPEDQNTYVEPECCTSFGTLNAVETLARAMFTDTEDYSDRFLACISGTTQQGNDPHTVAETLRLKGDVPETSWPYTQVDNTWSTFYETPPQALSTEALIFPAKYDFGHQWINPTADNLKAALQSSPLGVGGYAWAIDENGFYYTPPGALPCHWFALVGYVDGEYWLVYDSYSPELKRLRWDYQFALAKQYTLTLNIQKPSAWSAFINWMGQVVAQMLQMEGPSFGAARSSQWPRVRTQFIKDHPTCAVCGSTRNLNVHHIQPFHVKPELELSVDNLTTLCRTCHYLFGHLLDWKSWNSTVTNDETLWRNKILSRPY